MFRFTVPFLLVLPVLSLAACREDPYVDPQTSQAVHVKEIAEKLDEHQALLEEQNRQLKRIADALEQRNANASSP